MLFSVVEHYVCHGLYMLFAQPSDLLSELFLLQGAHRSGVISISGGRRTLLFLLVALGNILTRLRLRHRTYTVKMTLKLRGYFQEIFVCLVKTITVLNDFEDVAFESCELRVFTIF